MPFRQISKKTKPSQTSAITFELDRRFRWIDMNASTMNCVKTTLQCYIQELIDKASNTNISEKIDNGTKCDDCTKMGNMISFTESNICIRVIINNMVLSYC